MRGPSPLVLRVLGATMLAVAAGMAACAGLAVVLGDGGELSLGLPAGAAAVLAAVALWTSRSGLPVNPRVDTVLLATTVAWLGAAVVGALPFLVSGAVARPLDALFESMSGFTTTGASVLAPRVEDLPRSLATWRSATQWLGGLGFVVLMVAATPRAVGIQRMLGSEASGPTTERRTSRIGDTARLLSLAYLALTAIGLAAYLAAGMDLFHAANHVMTTVSTGGFSTRAGSIGEFDSFAVELVAIGLMILGATSFTLYASLLARSGPYRLQITEAVVMVTIIAAAAVAVWLSLLAADDVDGAAAAARAAAFQMTSLGTATGFSTRPFAQWNDFALTVILVIVFIGGCAGSTAGGLKVLRAMLLTRIVWHELRRHVDPRRVAVLRVGGRVYADDVRHGVVVLAVIWLAVFILASLVLTALGVTLRDALGAVAATLNTVGPSIGAQPYVEMPEAARAVLTACMLIGRLEIVTIAILIVSFLSRPPGR